jgi:hypothetical protein
MVRGKALGEGDAERNGSSLTYQIVTFENSEGGRRGSYDEQPKTPIFEAPAPAFDCFNTDSFISENGRHFSVHCFVSLPLQEQEFDHTSLLAPAH